MTSRPHFPPAGYAVRCTGRWWRASSDCGTWRGPLRTCYRDALYDALAQSQPAAGYAERRAARGG